MQVPLVDPKYVGDAISIYSTAHRHGSFTCCVYLRQEYLMVGGFVMIRVVKTLDSVLGELGGLERRPVERRQPYVVLLWK